MKRVYCLYRVSTKGQVDHDDIPMQRTACRAFAEKNGWTICKEFLEKGVSGYKVSANERDAIQDLKIAAEKKEFDILSMTESECRRQLFFVAWFCDSDFSDTESGFFA